MVLKSVETGKPVGYTDLPVIPTDKSVRLNYFFKLIKLIQTDFFEFHKNQSIFNQFFNPCLRHPKPTQKRKQTKHTHSAPTPTLAPSRSSLSPFSSPLPLLTLPRPTRPYNPGRPPSRLWARVPRPASSAS
jgi:hypothetical protein